MSLCLHVTYAQKPDTTKTFIQGKELGEVVVKSSYLTRKGDHILAIPTKEQRKHAVTGYDLLSNLMIPGVSVERSTGSVTTPNGAATLYIDGREVDFREVQSLRPKDVSRVEYFDVPTGKYAKDAYAINIIMKPLNNGGYTQLDASQNVGYLYGDYNLISKFVTGTKSFNLWAGYSLENPKSSMNEDESFIFPDYQLNRLQHYNNADNRQTEEYVQASISNRGRKYIWMLRGGMAWNIITAKPKAHAFKNEMCFPLTKTKCELKKHPNSKFECFFYDFNRTKTSLFLPFPSKLIQDNLVCVLELQE